MKDTHQPGATQEARNSFEDKTAAREAAARRAAIREREHSEGRATESTFNVRTVQREVGMQSRVRHEWHANGEIREVPLLRPDLRTWKDTDWAWQSRELTPRPVVRIYTCEVCSKEFPPTRSDAKTCGAACRKKAFRLRKKAVEAQQ